MDRLDYYFRQLVTEGEVDLGFDQVQDRIETAARSDETAFDGMSRGGAVTESSPPALTVEVAGDAVGYTSEGRRVAWTDPEQVDVSLDKLGAPTTVVTPGNSKILSVFVEFDENLQDLRLDGNSIPVYFQRLAAHNIYIIQSAEAVSPVAPPLLPDAILLCDISLAHSQTTVVNANIDVSRRQDYFRNESGSTTQIVRGNARDVMNDLLDAHNGFIDDLANTASGPSFGGSLVGLEAVSGTPTGGSALGFPATDLQSALADIVSDLTGSPGATKVGANAKSGSNVTLPTPLSLNATQVDDQISDMLDYLETIRNTPFAASAVSYSPHDYVTSTNVQDALDEIIDDLQSTSGGAGNGAYEIGYKGLTQALTSTTYANMNISAGPVETALDDITARLAAMVQRGGDTIGGFFTFTSSYPWRFTPSSLDIATMMSNTATVRANLSWKWNFEGSDGQNTAMTLTGAGRLDIPGYLYAQGLNLSGNVSSNLIPSGTRDLGSGGAPWDDVYCNKLTVVNYVGSDLIPDTDATYNLGLTGGTPLRWQNAWFSGQVNFGKASLLYGPAGSTGIDSDWYPLTDGTRDLGETSEPKRWRSLNMTGGLYTDYDFQVLNFDDNTDGEVTIARRSLDASQANANMHIRFGFFGASGWTYPMIVRGTEVQIDQALDVNANATMRHIYAEGTGYDIGQTGTRFDAFLRNVNINGTFDAGAGTFTGAVSAGSLSAPTISASTSITAPENGFLYSATNGAWNVTGTPMVQFSTPASGASISTVSSRAVEDSGGRLHFPFIIPNDTDCTIQSIQVYVTTGSNGTTRVGLRSKDWASTTHTLEQYYDYTNVGAGSLILGAIFTEAVQADRFYWIECDLISATGSLYVHGCRIDLDRAQYATFDQWTM